MNKHFYFVVTLFFSSMSPLYAMQNAAVQNAQQRPAQTWMQRHPIITCLVAYAALITGNALLDNYQSNNSPREICHFRMANQPLEKDTTTAMTHVGTKYTCDGQRNDPRYIEVFDLEEEVEESHYDYL